MADEDITTFTTGEKAEYERWVRRNDGYVLTERWGEPEGFMLHEPTAVVGSSPISRVERPSRSTPRRVISAFAALREPEPPRSLSPARDEARRAGGDIEGGPWRRA
jgi:hypothetical protein